MSNVIKFQSPFERLKQMNENAPDLALRKAIILQAIIDASNISLSPNAKKLELDAKNWLFNNSEDFQKICYEAALEPDFVVKIAKEIIILHYKTEIADNESKNLIDEKLNLLV